MTHAKEIQQGFYDTHIDVIRSCDLGAVRFAWACYIDDLQKSRVISRDAANDVACPVWNYDEHRCPRITFDDQTVYLSVDQEERQDEDE